MKRKLYGVARGENICHIEPGGPQLVIQRKKAMSAAQKLKRANPNFQYEVFVATLVGIKKF